MTRLTTWLDELGVATATAERAESAYRADFSRRVAALAAERAHAHRRVNLMRAIADAVGSAEDEAAALAHGLASFRSRLGWVEDSPARDEIVGRFAPVCAAAHAAADEAAGHDGSAASPAETVDPATALAAFEGWYRETRGAPFWVLFDNPMLETPLVDF